ncbi:MAG TPA: DUF4845 domain-containing protein [Gammaproteobacteria bacterium]|jgi:hypothetical protein|nr:DUF4845 domain-containing protein [Gammaproteobacteria bacterium]
MSNRKHQSGLTMITWIVLVGMIGFIGIFAFKLIPIYMDFYTINSALITVAKDIRPGEAPAQIKSSISGLFDVNSVNTVKIDDIEIKPDPDGKGLSLNLDYDARTNFFANVDLIVHFEKTYPAGH